MAKCFKFFFFWSCSTHIKDHIIMKIEFCALSEFSEFDLEKKKKFKFWKKNIVLKSFSRLKKPKKKFFFSSVKCQDLEFFFKFFPNLKKNSKSWHLRLEKKIIFFGFFSLEKDFKTMFFFSKFEFFFFSKSNSENSERAQNSIFIIIWSLMCIEQVQKKKS